MPSAHIIGLGQSGVAAARLLKQQGWQVCASDGGASDALRQRQQQLAAQSIPVVLNYKFTLDSLEAQGFDRPDRIVVSPGVPWDVPGLVEARSQGIETLGEIELAWQHLQQYPWVGITGTNGKTTTTALVAAIFQTAGLHAPACGNIGYSACDLALSGQPIDWVIAELSSYQIESSPTIAPKIGIWTTFTPDHLSRHGTIENYHAIKASLLERSQLQILNGDDPTLRHLAHVWPQAWWTSTQGKAHLPLTGSSKAAESDHGVYLEDGWVIVAGTPIVPAQALHMPGAHNQQNLLLAVAAAHLAGIEPEAIVQAVSQFAGVPHRLERIYTWQGIDFINDSKATNYDAAQTGLASVEGPVILIAGGDPKTGNDLEWLQTIQQQAAAVLLIGVAAKQFAQRLTEVGYTNYEIVETMEQAVPRARELAKDYQAQTVLLSPACASFDQYQNFEQRGDHFRQLCLELLQ